MKKNNLRRSWVEISIPTLLRNIKQYSKYTQSISSIMAVVKADAYGHGAIKIAKALQGL